MGYYEVTDVEIRVRFVVSYVRIWCRGFALTLDRTLLRVGPSMLPGMTVLTVLLVATDSVAPHRMSSTRLMSPHTVLGGESVPIPAMHMACPSGRKKHFNRDDQKYRCHCNKTSHSRVAFVPNIRKAWVCQRYEGCGKEVDKGGRYQNAGAEMSRNKEKPMWDTELGETAGNDGKAAS